MRKVCTHVFNGTRYHIFVDELFEAWCDNPNKKNNGNEYPGIHLPNGLPFGGEHGAKSGLVNLIHESLHAENYGTTEKVVERVSIEIADLLWRLGYRRIK